MTTRSDTVVFTVGGSGVASMHRTHTRSEQMCESGQSFRTLHTRVDGSAVGFAEGDTDGMDVGDVVGPRLGEFEGRPVGEEVGAPDGWGVGYRVG